MRKYLPTTHCQPCCDLSKLKPCRLRAAQSPRGSALQPYQHFHFLIRVLAVRFFFPCNYQRHSHSFSFHQSFNMYILSNHLSFLQISILITLSAFLVEKASATLKFTNPSFADLTAGAPFNVTWSGASGTTTLTLQNGTASGIQTVGVIACNFLFLYPSPSPLTLSKSGFKIHTYSGRRTPPSHQQLTCFVWMIRLANQPTVLNSLC